MRPGERIVLVATTVVLVFAAAACVAGADRTSGVGASSGRSSEHELAAGPNTSMTTVDTTADIAAVPDGALPPGVVEPEPPEPEMIEICGEVHDRAEEVGLEVDLVVERSDGALTGRATIENTNDDVATIVGSGGDQLEGYGTVDGVLETTAGGMRASIGTWIVIDPGESVEVPVLVGFESCAGEHDEAPAPEAFVAVLGGSVGDRSFLVVSAPAVLAEADG
jgi:hypothetical protein